MLIGKEITDHMLKTCTVHVPIYTMVAVVEEAEQCY